MAKPIPSDEELKAEALSTVINIMRDATKKSDYIEVVCKECGKRQRAQGEIKDRRAILDACKEILDRKEGKAATKKEVPKPQTVGRDLDELTDAELEALLLVEEGDEPESV